jgi:hypothetical protein
MEFSKEKKHYMTLGPYYFKMGKTERRIERAHYKYQLDTYSAIGLYITLIAMFGVNIFANDDTSRGLLFVCLIVLVLLIAWIVREASLHVSIIDDVEAWIKNNDDRLDFNDMKNDIISKQYFNTEKCIGMIIFLAVLVSIIFWSNITVKLSYQDFDLIVKSISGIGTIIAGLFIYMKWQDEKTRQLYERSLKKVYAPLIGVLIRQEEYRKVVNPDITFKDAPILSIKTTTFHKKITFTKDGLKAENSKEERAGLLSNKHFLTALKGDEEAYGLMSPTLLTYIKSYGILLSLEEDKIKDVSSSYGDFRADKKTYDKAMETEEGKDLLKITDRRSEIEEKLIREIVKGYNNCVRKLDMYDDRITILQE